MLRKSQTGSPMGAGGGSSGKTIATLMCVNGAPVTYNLYYA